MSEPTLTIGKLSDFREQQQNANRHTPRGMSLLESSMQEDGYVAPMTATADNEVIDGSARLETSAEVFSPDAEAVIVEHDGTRPIVMKLTNLPNAQDERAKRIAARANRIAQINLDFDPEIVQSLRLEIPALGPLWTDEEMHAQFGDLTNGKTPIEDVEPQIDRAEELREQWGVELGQLWQLGPHRLLCGDSTKREDVERVMGGELAAMSFTSPPYNVGASATLHGNTFMPDTKYGAGGKDDLSTDDYLDLLTGFTRQALSVSQFVFVNLQPLAGNKLALVDYLHTLRDHLADFAIWDKQHAAPAMAQRVMNSQFEFVFIFSREKNPTRAIGTAEWRGTVPNVYSAPPQRNNEFSEMHAATFPLHLPLWGIGTFSVRTDLIYEPFSGSGTTIIACEQLGRQGRAIEIAPAYVAVALQRFYDATKIKPQLL